MTKSQLSALEVMLSEMAEEQEMILEIRAAMQMEGFLAAFYDSYNPLDDEESMC